MSELNNLILKAVEYRLPVLEKLKNESTDSYRVFHGINEGKPGLTVDRYGPLILVQTFREPLSGEETNQLKEILFKSIEPYYTGEKFFVYNHRGEEKDKGPDYWFKPEEKALETKVFYEMGLKYVERARHRGQDPYLFLDMRAGRRYILNNSKDLSVLNLFAYTCGTGICAIAGGAKEVWNIDFSASWLEIGNENAKLNGFSDSRFRNINCDVFSALKQFAGIPFKGRGSTFVKPDVILKQRTFDIVFLDPPAWSKSPFGTVDLIRDYQSLFKPALLSTTPGGRVIAVNNVAKVNLEDWLDILRRCAVKAGREIKNIEVIQPEDDFPSPDRNYPLKVAVCEV